MSAMTIPFSEKVFTADDPSVADHKIFDRMVVPFAAWITWAQEILVPSSADQTREFADLLARRPLSIDIHTARSVRFIIQKDDADSGRFQVAPADSTAGSSEADSIVEGRWRLPSGAFERLSVPSTRTSWNAADFYDAARRGGLSYGPSFRQVERIESGADGWLAKMRLLDGNADPNQRWLAALDAMLQGGAVVTTNTATVGWIPYRIDMARLADPDNFRVSPVGVIVGRWVTTNADERVAHIDWVDPQSEQVVVALRGVHFRQAPALEAAAPAKTSASTTDSVQSQAGARQSLLARLRAADAAARKEILASSIEEHVLQLLKWNESKRKDLSRGFVAIGLDSLLAVDLQFRLQTELKFSLPPGTGLNQPTIDELADFLLSQHPEFRP